VTIVAENRTALQK